MIEVFAYELRFKMTHKSTKRDIDRVYKSIAAFEKQLNRQLRENRNGKTTIKKATPQHMAESGPLRNHRRLRQS